MSPKTVKNQIYSTMINFTDVSESLFNKGVLFSVNDYMFCLNLAVGENPYISYALAFHGKEYGKVLGTEDEKKFLLSKKGECDTLMQHQTIIKLRQEIEELYNTEVQKKALNLEDYHFTGGQIAQILQNLLQNRISDLDSASTKDVISLIKLLTDQFGLDGGSDFEKHFIQIYPKFNALCTSCNREFQVTEGLGAVCPHCGASYHWDSNSEKFIPQPTKL